MDERVKPSIFEANILYLILGIGLIVVGSIVQSREIYSGLLITEYILILLPNLLYLKLKGHSFKKVLRLNKLALKQIIMIFFIMIFAYPLAIFLQSIVISIISIFREVTPNLVPLPENRNQFIMSFFIIAVSPGICEEVMFRGVLLDSYSRLGWKKGIIITSFLFAIFHFTLLNFAGPFVLGIVLGIILYKTNSLYGPILGHTVSNTIALTIGYFVNKYYYLIDGLIQESPENNSIFPSQGLLAFVILFFMACFLIVVSLLKRLSPSVGSEREDNLLLTGEDIFPDELESKIEESKQSKLIYMPLLLFIIGYVYINLNFVLL